MLIQQRLIDMLVGINGIILINSNNISIILLIYYIDYSKYLLVSICSIKVCDYGQSTYIYSICVSVVHLFSLHKFLCLWFIFEYSINVCVYGPSMYTLSILVSRRDSIWEIRLTIHSFPVYTMVLVKKMNKC